MIAEKIMAGIATASIGEYKVSGVGVDVEDHVAGVISQDSEWVC